MAVEVLASERYIFGWLSDIRRFGVDRRVLIADYWLVRGKSLHSRSLPNSREIPGCNWRRSSPPFQVAFCVDRLIILR